MINAFGVRIKTFRKSRRWTLSKVSQHLGVDQAIVSKAERGLRSLTKQQVFLLSELFEVSPEVLMIPWLADRVALAVGEEAQIAPEAFQLAKEVVAFRNYEPFNLRRNYQDLIDVIARFGQVRKAWIYGSFAKKRVHAQSDVNLVLTTSGDFSYFDLAEIQNKLEKRLGRPTDIGWMDNLKKPVLDTVKEELVLIYEKV
ncbi:hypothetical protein ADIS_1315 [Lunatimonas lonarensis]|uniref:HTH cro/C1-type domain-containing protein n=1 Tax=Lunatimonas lonarensis TaxID=1232681 RepID=R7ZVT0_9BACT|nr:helix-turn-helix domain-containing protein [Lunatimonas lonarensis]EON78118.1 hypothetical protein ADIS_1315 [Lunatimonas lonarensis]